MSKKGTVHHISSKKRSRPKVRFNFWVLVIIFVISFGACFGLYMLAANTHDDFLDDDEKTSSTQEVGNDSEDKQDATSASDTDTAAEESPQVNITNPVPQSEAVDESYFDNTCIITDSTLLDIASYTNLKDVIGSAELNASNCNNLQITSPYGVVTARETVQLKKPANLYIMLGSDIGTAETDAMIAAYTDLVDSVHSYLKDTKIYVMQLPPVAYDTETVTNARIDEYNSKLLAMATNSGVYCIDTNVVLKSAEGTLAPEYWSAEEGKMTEAAYKAISDYIRTHIA